MILSQIVNDAGSANNNGFTPAAVAKVIVVGIKITVLTVLLVNTMWLKLATNITIMNKIIGFIPAKSRVPNTLFNKNAATPDLSNANPPA